MSNPNDHDFKGCYAVSDAQGWNDTTLLGMLISWLEENGHCEQVRQQLQTNADEENAFVKSLESDDCYGFGEPESGPDLTHPTPKITGTTEG